MKKVLSLMLVLTMVLLFAVPAMTADGQNGVTVNFPGVSGVTVQYYTNVSQWVTVGTFNDVCKFVVPDNHKATWGATTVQVIKGGMYHTFSLDKLEPGTVLNVPIKKLMVFGLAAECNIGVIQNDWIYSLAPAQVGAANFYNVFDNGKDYKVQLYRPGFYPITATATDDLMYYESHGASTWVCFNNFYQITIPEGVANVWISSYDWATRGAKAGDNIVLLCDYYGVIRDAKMSFIYEGKTYNADIKLDGANPFAGLIEYDAEHNHVWAVKEVIAPACGAQGYTVYQCSVCGEFKNDDFVAALAHVEGPGVITVPAACEAEGEMIYYCELCGEALRAEIIPALGHNWVVKAVIPPTDSSQGYTIYECSRCGEFKNDDFVAALGHVEGPGIVTTPPACEIEGVLTYYCVLCGEALRTEPIPPLGHDWLVKEIIAPTCEAQGYSIYQCSRCGEFKSEDFVAALGHDWQIKELIAPTCEAQGYNVYECSRCGAIKNDDYVAALGHDLITLETVAATCEEEGYTVTVCSRCDYEEKAILQALGHDWQVKEIIPPTATTQGYTIYKCSRCDEEKFDDYVDALEGVTVTIAAGEGGKIVNGASGEYEAGAKIELEAQPAEGYVFSTWTSSNGGEFADANSAQTIFTVPANNVTVVTAHFRIVGDDLSDEIKEMLGLDKTTDDTDGDGLKDLFEFLYLDTSPLLVDTDENGISDANEDFDGDGLTNIQEQELGTRPDLFDTDGDGLNDGDEVNIYSTDPLNDDTDSDGLTDGEEIKLGLDPNKPKTDGVTPDSERKFYQVAEDIIKDDALINSDNWLVPSVSGNVPGDISRNVFLEKSDNNVFEDNHAVLSDVINTYISYEMPLTLTFEYSQAYSGDIRNLTIVSFKDYELEIIDTVLDEAGKRVSGEITGSGMYFVIDLDEFLKRLGIDVFANIEPIKPLSAAFSGFNVETDGVQSAQTVSLLSPLDVVIPQNSPELFNLIGMAEKTQTGSGYGPNGKFLAPINPPVAGSIPISTRAELETIANSTASLRANYHLTRDIDLSGVEWTPIGSSGSGNYFTGVFDGQGHIIKNLTITGSKYQYAGLFGYASTNAEIKNIGLEGTNINVSYSAAIRVGGICAYKPSSSRSISNCYNIGNIAASATGIAYVGGIHGDGYGSISNCYNNGNMAASSTNSSAVYVGGIYGRGQGAISNCYNSGEVTASSLGSVYAGGIYGHGYGGSSNNTIVSNCYNTGNISVPSSNIAYVGAMNGDGYGAISNCYNSGNTSVTSSGITYVGGIYGRGQGTITNCYNSGEVTASSSSSIYVSGIYGHGYGGNSSNTIVSNCYNIGNISIPSSNTAYVGGINSDGYSSISYCYNSGNTSVASSGTTYVGGIYGRGQGAISNCSSTGDIIVSSSQANVGGIFGYGYSNTKVFSCNNLGNISVSTLSAAYCGGIQGRLGTGAGEVSNCFNTGIVSVSSSGAAYGGGIHGDNSGKILNCYNTGSVYTITSATSSTNVYAYAGGISGNNLSEIIENSVVLANQISAIHDNRPTYIRSYIIGYGGAKASNLALAGIGGNAIDDVDSRISAVEACSRATYETLGWDFTNVWEIVPGYNYPQLKGLPTAPGNSDTDDEPVILDDFQIVQLSDRLSNAWTNDTDHDGITDAQELGTSLVLDMTKYIILLLSRHAAPPTESYAQSFAAESYVATGFTAENHAATGYSLDDYTGKTKITVWKYISNPVLLDTDYDGIPDGNIDYDKNIVTRDPSPKSNAFKGTLYWAEGFGGKQRESILPIEFVVDYRLLFEGNTNYKRDLSVLASLYAANMYDDSYLMVTSGAVGGSESDKRALGTLFGLKDIEPIIIEGDDYGVDVDDSTEFIIGHREVTYGGSTREIIIVAVRGTNGSNAEWSSNFDVGADTSDYYAATGQHPDWKNKNNHKGFDVAANRIIAQINSYLSRWSLTTGMRSILILGHSRGAAIANLIGAHYENDPGFTSFTYTFATPNPTTDSTAESYKTIFNIVNQDDIIAYLPLSNWGFKKYGALKDYSVYKHYVNFWTVGKWQLLTGIPYNHDGGTQRTLNCFAKLANNRTQLYVLDSSADGRALEGIGYNTRDGAEKALTDLTNTLKAEKLLQFCELSVAVRGGGGDTIRYYVEANYCPAYLMQTLANMKTEVGPALGRNTTGKYALAKTSFVASSGKLGIGGMAHPHWPITYYLIVRENEFDH